MTEQFYRGVSTGNKMLSVWNELCLYGRGPAKGSRHGLVELALALPSRNTSRQLIWASSSYNTEQGEYHSLLSDQKLAALWRP